MKVEREEYWVLRRVETESDMMLYRRIGSPFNHDLVAARMATVLCSRVTVFWWRNKRFVLVLFNRAILGMQPSNQCYCLRLEGTKNQTWVFRQLYPPDPLSARFDLETIIEPSMAGKHTAMQLASSPQLQFIHGIDAADKLRPAGQV
jgi:hypothetical protein